MSELSERERLTNELKQLKKPYHSQPFIEYDQIDIIADFILKDRARIIEPLEQIEEEISKLSPDKSEVEIVILILMFCNNYIKASRETLKRARGGE